MLGVAELEAAGRAILFRGGAGVAGATAMSPGVGVDGAGFTGPEGAATGYAEPGWTFPPATVDPDADESTEAFGAATTSAEDVAVSQTEAQVQHVQQAENAHRLPDAELRVGLVAETDALRRTVGGDLGADVARVTVSPVAAGGLTAGLPLAPSPRGGIYAGTEGRLLSVLVDEDARLRLSTRTLAVDVAALVAEAEGEPVESLRVVDALGAGSTISAVLAGGLAPPVGTVESGLTVLIGPVGAGGARLALFAVAWWQAEGGRGKDHTGRGPATDAALDARGTVLPLNTDAGGGVPAVGHVFERVAAPPGGTPCRLGVGVAARLAALAGADVGADQASLTAVEPGVAVGAHLLGRRARLRRCFPPATRGEGL